MSDQKPVGNDERETRNRGLQEEAKRQQDPDARAPRASKEQHAPDAVRPTTPDEKSSEDLAQLENPPQSEGPRERSNDAV